MATILNDLHNYYHYCSTSLLFFNIEPLRRTFLENILFRQAQRCASPAGRAAATYFEKCKNPDKHKLCKNRSLARSVVKALVLCITFIEG
jgi:hypothetical protein